MIHDWNEHYRIGNTSGAGSIGIHREWKWKIIEKYTEKITDAVDIGCGDLSFWEGRHCDVYTGVDISKHIISQNKKARSSWQFFTHNASQYNSKIAGDIVLCMDLLFHILDDYEFKLILKNLCFYASDWIFIFTWVKNPFLAWYARKSFLVNKQWKNLFNSLTHRFTTDNYFQKYRNLLDYLDIFEESKFILKAIEIPEFDKVSAMYVFEREQV